jgi:hypothetical protein
MSAAAVVPVAPRLTVEYCGEWTAAPAGTDFRIGRRGNVVIDDDAVVPDTVATLTSDSRGVWSIQNATADIVVTVVDATGRFSSRVLPGLCVPLVFERQHLIFRIASTTYDLTVDVSQPLFTTTAHRPSDDADDATWPSELPVFTESQRVAILALAEPALRSERRGVGTIPTSVAAAGRLGWTVTRFNRKLDNICDKLDRFGVAGLRGGVGRYATSRRLRLVEYAVGSGIVTLADLALLDDWSSRGE